jgi:di/tricarboxylate transporter
MTTEMWITLFILATAIVLFVTEWLRVDVVALTVVVALMVSGILDPGEALSGFSNTAVLTIAALFVVGGAVLSTGLAGMIADSILKIAGNSESRLISVIMGAVGILSGFMSDTGVVALMLPAITSLANRSKINPSRLLIPLTYGSLLGGASTMIGTPPNLIVAELLVENGLHPFSFFSFTPMGLILMLTGILFMVLVGRRLLPDRAVRRDVQEVETPEELLNLYRLPDSLFRLRVRSRSRLVGQTLSASDLGRDFGISVLEIARPAQPRTVARIASQKIVIQSEEDELLRPRQDFTIQTDDVLIVQGQPSEISKAAARWSLSIQPAEPADQESLISGELGIAEVVLPPRSSLIGKTLRDIQFGTRFRLTVLNIHRPGAETIDLKTSRLQFGDTLLVQGEWTDIERLRRMRRDFVVLGASELAAAVQNRKKAPLALAILLGM